MLWLAVLIVWVGCSAPDSPPPEQAPNQLRRREEIREQLRVRLGERYDVPLPAGTLEQVRNGARLYDRLCRSCHGATARGDGRSAAWLTVQPSNLRDPLTAAFFSVYPLQVVRQALRRGSGGAGAHRGGDGLIREYRVLCDEITLTTMFERRLIPPYGLQGGEPGAPFRVRVVKADGESFEAPGKANLTLARGDRVILESSGGGGYGRPREIEKEKATE